MFSNDASNRQPIKLSSYSSTSQNSDDSRFKHIRIVSGVCLVISVTALNVLFICFRANLNTSFLFTYQGAALFFLPAAAVTISGAIFGIFSFIREKPHLNIEDILSRKRENTAKTASELPLPFIDITENPQTDTFVDIDLTTEDQPNPVSEGQTVPEGKKEVENVGSGKVEVKPNYTEKDVISKFIGPAFNKIRMVLRSLLVADMSAYYPKGTPDQVANWVKSDVLKLEQILTSLWQLFINHYNDMKFAQTVIASIQEPNLEKSNDVRTKLFVQISQDSQVISRLETARETESSQDIDEAVLTILKQLPQNDPLLPFFSSNKDIVIELFKNMDDDEANSFCVKFLKKLDFALPLIAQAVSNKYVFNAFKSFFENYEAIKQESECKESYEGMKKFTQALLPVFKSTKPPEKIEKFLLILTNAIGSVPKDEIQSFLSDVVRERENELQSLLQLARSGDSKSIEANQSKIAIFPSLVGLFDQLTKQLKQNEAQPYSKQIQDLEQARGIVKGTIDKNVKELKFLSDLALTEDPQAIELQKGKIALFPHLKAPFEELAKQVQRLQPLFIQNKIKTLLEDVSIKKRQSLEVLSQLTMVANPHAIESQKSTIDLFPTLIAPFDELAKQLEQQKNTPDPTQVQSLNQMRSKVKDAVNDVAKNSEEDLKVLLQLASSVDPIAIASQKSKIALFPTLIAPFDQLVKHLSQQKTSYDATLFQSYLNSARFDVKKAITKTNESLNVLLQLADTIDPLRIDSLKPTIVSFPNLNTPFEQLKKQVGSLDSTRTRAKIKDTISKNKIAHLDIPNSILEGHLIRFLTLFIKKSFSLIEDDPSVKGLNLAAKELNSFDLEKSLSGEGVKKESIDQFLFMAELFFPMLSVFFDTDEKLSKFDALKNLHMAHGNFKKIINLKNVPDPIRSNWDSEIKKIEEDLEKKQEIGDQLNEQIKALEEKKSLRTFILQRLHHVSDLFSRKLGYAVKLVEKGPDYTPSEEEKKLCLELEKQFPIFIQAIRQDLAVLEIQNQIIVEKVPRGFDFDQWKLEQVISLSLETQTGIELKTIPLQEVDKIDFIKFYLEFNRGSQIHLLPLRIAEAKKKLQELQKSSPDYKICDERIKTQETDLKKALEGFNEFKGQCLKAHGLLRKDKYIHQMEEVVNKDHATKLKDVEKDGKKEQVLPEPPKIVLKKAIGIESLNKPNILKLFSKHYPQTKLGHLLEELSATVKSMKASKDDYLDIYKFYENKYKSLEQELQKEIDIFWSFFEAFKIYCLEANKNEKEGWEKAFQEIEKKLKSEMDFIEKSKDTNLNAKTSPLMLFPIPVPFENVENPLIYIKPYQGGIKAGLLWFVLKATNVLKSLEGIISLATWIIEKFTHKKVEIPLLNGLPGFHDEQFQVLVKAICGIFYLYDIQVYNLVLSKDQATKKWAKKLVDETFLKLLKNNLPAFLAKKEHTPASLLKDLFNAVELIMNDLDPHKIRERNFV